MDQVGGSGIGDADGMSSQHQHTHDVVGLGTGSDRLHVMLRQETREKISEYLGRGPIAAKWRPRLPDLVRRLEEILFREYPNKMDYYNMVKGPTEPHFLIALTILSAHDQQFQQNQQLLRQIASFHGYGTTTRRTGTIQGASANSRMPRVTYNMGPQIGAGLVPPIASMGTSLPGEAPNEHVNTELSLGMNHTPRSSRVSNQNPHKVTPAPPATVKDVSKKPKFSCPVCLNELVDASSTICGHIFCEKCIMASVKAQRKCPTCRRKLTMKKFHRVFLPTMD